MTAVMFRHVSTTALIVLALSSLALAACGGGGADGGAATLTDGRLTVRPPSGAWSPSGPGPVAFASGTTIEATAEGATLDASLGGKSSVRLRLEPGARLSRRDVDAFDLDIGTVTVTTTDLADRVLVYHADTYVEAGRVVPGDATFTATAVGPQLAIVAETGSVQLNATGDTPMELNYATLGPGEQGLAEKKKQSEIRHLDDSPAGTFLTPRISLAAEDGPVGDALRLTITIAPGQSGTFHGLAVGGESPDSLVIVASGPGGERTIPLRAEHAPHGVALPPSVHATADAPFVVPFEVRDHGLAPGAWTLRVRYLSYREHADGPEWIGRVESESVAVDIGE